jgi:hypothetical protein
VTFRINQTKPKSSRFGKYSFAGEVPSKLFQEIFCGVTHRQADIKTGQSTNILTAAMLEP